MPYLTRSDNASVWGPTREWWVFNPGPRLDICLEEGVYDFVYHQKTYEFKRNMAISPKKHLLQLGQNYPWRVMLIDYHEDLALLYTNEKGWDEVAGVFPMWSVSRSTDELVKLLERYPEPGERVGLFTGAPQDSYAIEDQEKRVILCNFPSGRDAWEDVFRDLMDVKRDFPEFIFHFNGQKSMPRTLGTGVDSFDHPVTLEWSDGQPHLLMANGKYIYPAGADNPDNRKWSKLVGIMPRSIFDLDDRVVKSRRMYLFNLRSIKWAFSNYATTWAMRVFNETEVDVDNPDTSWVPVDLQYRPRADKITDRWICDLCSIQNRCPFFRTGAICIVDDTEAASLAKKFQTRNAWDIVDALGILVAAGAQRTKDALAAEQEQNAMNPDVKRFSKEVTAMMSATFDQGVTLARLIDPTLGGGLGAGGRRGRGGRVIDTHEVTGATPQELAAGIMKQLEERGYDIHDLTPEQAQTVLAESVPGGRMPTHDHDHVDAAGSDAGGGSHVVGAAPPFRATPSFDPGVPGADVPEP